MVVAGVAVMMMMHRKKRKNKHNYEKEGRRLALSSGRTVLPQCPRPRKGPHLDTALFTGRPCPIMQFPPWFQAFSVGDAPRGCQTGNPLVVHQKVFSC